MLPIPDESSELRTRTVASLSRSNVKLTRPVFAFALAHPFDMQSAVPPLALGGFTANEVRVQLFFTSEDQGEARLL